MADEDELSENGSNPLDVVERIIKDRNWRFERTDSGTLVALAESSWLDFQLRYQWFADIEEHSISCGFEQKVPDPTKRPEILTLISLINKHLPVGAFMWEEDSDFLMYHYVLQLAGGVRVAKEQCEVMLKIALSTCERYYPAFQYILWAGKCAEEAFKLVSLQTRGSLQ